VQWDRTFLPYYPFRDSVGFVLFEGWANQKLSPNGFEELVLRSRLGACEIQVITGMIGARAFLRTNSRRLYFPKLEFPKAPF